MRAAASEHRALLHHRERLAAKRRRLQGELQRVQTAVQAIDERLGLLDRLTAEPDLTEQDHRQPGIALEPQREHLLHGRAIRETAVKVLLSQPQEIEALHYRSWYELVRQAGYSIAGATRSQRFSPS